MNNHRFLCFLAAAAVSIFATSAQAGDKQRDPTDIGDFDKRQFVIQAQALTLGKDINHAIGSFAYANTDGSLTITGCRQIVGTLNSVTTADLSQPIFSAIIDGNWGLKVTLTFLNISSAGNMKTAVTATDVADVALPLENIPDQVTVPSSGCNIPKNAAIWYVEKATLSLINKTTYVQTDNTGGLLSFLTVSGASYKEQDETNRYTVSVFAVPVVMSNDQKVATVAKTQAQLVELAARNVKALGVDKTVGGVKAVVDTKFTKTLKPAHLAPELVNQIGK